MKERNPFFLRASQHIDSDEEFVSLFSPSALNMLNINNVLERPLVVRSARGGGKTSLLRLFCPRSLLTVHRLRKGDHCKDLFEKLKSIGALKDIGPSVLGVYLSCGQGYAALEELNTNSGTKQRLFFSMLNARLTLAALQGLLELKGLTFPEGLTKVHIDLPSKSPHTSLEGLADISTGEGLYEWAKSLEKRICDAVDSFEPIDKIEFPGHDSIFALKILNPTSIKFNGSAVCDRIIFMLDDVSFLASCQRGHLINEIVKEHYAIGLWVAERLEALKPDELLSMQRTQLLSVQGDLGRDYSQITTLEEFWRGGGKSFEGLLSDIANRRVRSSPDIKIASFSDLLQESLDGMEWQQQFIDIKEAIASKIRTKIQGLPRYSEWLSKQENMSLTPMEDALSWQILDIMIERDRARVQRTFDFAVAADDSERIDSPAVRAAAELFICKNFGIPYYYGMSRLYSTASYNIQQFLAFAGDFFEHALSAAVLKEPVEIKLEAQERILKQAAKKFWDSFAKGTDIRRFIESICRFAEWVTYQPRASYAPGVTGIAISMNDRERLRNPEVLRKNPEFKRLASVIANCIASNFLEVTLDHKCKGQYWMVLNLNRIFCLHFNLPLQYGGWREKPLKELVEWLTKRFDPPKKSSDLF